MDLSTGQLVGRPQAGPLQSQHPTVMNAYGTPPALAGGPARPANMIIAALTRLLVEQEQRYGNGEQPPVLVQQLPYDGPPLRYLLTGRWVRFCNTREEVLQQYDRIPANSGLGYHPVPEYAASLQGPRTSGIVRARVNTTGHAPSAITSTLANELGLQHRPLRGPGAVSTIMYNGQPMPLDVLTEPLTVQLLAGPGNVAFEFTLPAVVVLPGSPSRNNLFELQLGLFDFCAAMEVDWLPMWASQFTVKATGQTWALPVVAPPPPHICGVNAGSSTFHIAQESYDEVLDIAIARQAVMARRAAAAATVAGNSEGPSPSDAAQEAMQQASRRIAITPGGVALTATTVLAAGTQEWVDEWAPASRRRRTRSSQVGRRSTRRSRGRGRGGASRQQLASQDPQAADLAAESVTGSVGESESTESVDAARAASGVYAGLEPLPTGLVASRWCEVAATSLPEGDVECTICTEAFTEELDGGGERLVTQLHCRHTYCVLCLRQFSTNRSFRRRSLQCPQCRAEV